MSEDHDRETRSIQVTGALDWPRSENNSTESAESIPLSSSTTAALGGNEDDSRISNSPIPQQYLLLVAIIVPAIGALLVALIRLKKQRDIARWHEVLQAQDEAFDLTEEIDFDLELVEMS